MINRYISENPKDNILCITYTNRAADELIKDITAPNVFIGTIHSFLHEFMKRYFSHKNALSIYFNMFNEAIKKRIENADVEEHITNSNEKYLEKYGALDYETVKKNITILSALNNHPCKWE